MGIEEFDKKLKSFSLKLTVHREDINEDTNREELIKFRGLIINLLSFVTICPIKLLNKGTFIFCIGENKWKQTSLGPMVNEYSPSVLGSYGAIINGLTTLDVYAAALYFFEKAVSAEKTLYEFINLEICCELIINKDSKSPRSVNPKCKNGHELANSPSCGCDWLIPNSFRNRSGFIMDEKLSRDFSNARAKVFHGSPSQLDERFLRQLKDLNMQLFVCLRNYLGQKVNIEPIKIEDLPPAIKLKDTKVMMSVFYTTPSST